MHGKHSQIAILKIDPESSQSTQKKTERKTKYERKHVNEIIRITHNGKQIMQHNKPLCFLCQCSSAPSHCASFQQRDPHNAFILDGTGG